MVDWIRSTVAEVSILGRVTTMQAEKLLRFVKDWKKGALELVSELHVNPTSNDKRTLTNTMLFHEGKKGIFVYYLFHLK